MSYGRLSLLYPDHTYHVCVMTDAVDINVSVLGVTDASRHRVVRRLHRLPPLIFMSCKCNVSWGSWALALGPWHWHLDRTDSVSTNSGVGSRESGIGNRECWLGDLEPSHLWAPSESLT